MVRKLAIREENHHAAARFLFVFNFLLISVESDRFYPISSLDTFIRLRSQAPVLECRTPHSVELVHHLMLHQEVFDPSPQIALIRVGLDLRIR